MASLWRLFGFLRPYRRAALGSLLFAWLAMGVTVLIPLLIGKAVDVINDGSAIDKDELWPLALAILGAGVLRLGLTVVRRIIAGKVSVAVEFDLREHMYAQLQRLELGFFDTQQTGQLMSRATVDLQSIRFFLGYGLIFLTQNALTIVLASIVMFALDPLLAALALATRADRGRDGRALQPAQPSRAAGGAAAPRRVDGGGRGERLGDSRREGVRARGAHAPPLPALGRAGVRPERLLHAPARLLQPADGLPALDRTGRGAVRRRAAR